MFVADDRDWMLNVEVSASAQSAEPRQPDAPQAPSDGPPAEAEEAGSPDDEAGYGHGV